MGVLLLLSSSTSATLCCDSENVMKQKCIKSISFALKKKKKKYTKTIFVGLLDRKVVLVKGV